VSVSLMMRLRSRPTSADELMKSYSTRAMVERRIDHLKSGGFLIEEDGQIALLERGRALVRAFALARAFFKHRRSLDIGVAEHGESGQRSRP
jgi:biotin operon repressor